MFLTMIAFFFVLSLLVVVHELGHFTVAKLSGIGVERFSVGLPPRLFGVRIGETEYCLSAIPFGGYVKLHGQDDFAQTDEFSGDPRDFRSKHPLVKIAVLSAGSLMNIVAAVVILASLFIMNGVSETTTRVGYVKPGTFAEQLGIVAGDEIVRVNDRDIENVDDILLPLVMNDSVQLVVHREGVSRTITTTRKLGPEEEFGAAPYYRAKVNTVEEGSPAARGGLLPGDVITEVDGETVDGWYHMSSLVQARPDSGITIAVLRDNAVLSFPVRLGSIEQRAPDGTVTTIGRLGVTQYIETIQVGFVDGSIMAVQYTGYLITHMLDFFGRLITGRMSANMLGGPVMIAQMAGESARSGFATLMAFTAFISINLGVLNLLPFPVLDGGHITILLAEMVTRRKVSERVQLAIQQFGTLVLLILMLYITFNDIMRFDAIANFFSG